jgi:hypothetical protein
MLLAIIQIATAWPCKMSRSSFKCPWIWPIFFATAAVSATATAAAAESISEDSYNHCRAISDDRDRLLCFENLAAPQPQKTPSPVPVVPDGAESTPDNPLGSMSGSHPGTSSIPVAGKWRLVRTPDPRAGREGKHIVSIMATAELSGSDVDFAGINLRCADPDFEVLIFLISPMRPQTQPAVAINDETFRGIVVSPGTAILLPREASALARKKWLSFPNLSIEVEDNGTKTHGLISLEGFNIALKTLVGTCLTR